MSDYTGPGIYEIVPRIATNKALNVWGGGNKAGTPVRLYPSRPTQENAKFEIVLAGGSSGDHEVGPRHYHILSYNSGLYLTAPSSQGQGKQVVMNIGPVADESLRWKLLPAGDGAFNVVSAKGDLHLNVEGSNTQDGANVIVWPRESFPNSQFYIKRV
ncbi:uncharacterized protein K452DRAFT_321883 [Aplosporella prunicola CBS 121167]|uniref:Ricin B lectin domain-containing protein n=1 Tax=Aplosporella prunicola CBS 121167 TaxID=1176127 RepID=A0A6A6B288_9PEZI|nr:uncharacterized protein K452DRAFT_321883 [Aplosporella prunicola CBS 121167]KAF2137334.1 hypothetical protein K452DRAFT_321883 [Aplosporella prunicola CBS 121167]